MCGSDAGRRVNRSRARYERSANFDLLRGAPLILLHQETNVELVMDINDVVVGKKW